MDSRKFRKYSPDQMLLLPPSLKDWLPEDHLAYFVGDLVESLDLGPFVKAYKNTPAGQPPFHPAMMLKVLVYGYATGVFSSRALAKKIDEDIAFKILACGERPDFRTIALFRKKHLAAFEDLFMQILKLAQAAGLVKMGTIAIDGTKLKANASRHKAMSYARMDEAERRLRNKVKDILKEADDIDLAEDDLYGEDKSGDELPPDLRDPVKRIKKIKELKERIEAEAKEKTGKDSATPKGKEQRSFTDYDSRLMKMSDGSYYYGYNGQIAVCGDPANGTAQIIVAATLTSRANDYQHLKELIEKAQINTEKPAKKLLADAGYFSADNLSFLKDRQIDAYVPPRKQKHSDGNPPPRGRIPANLSEADRMRRKLSTKKGKAVFARRKVIVEPVFGEQKGARGFRQFLLRGRIGATAEWNLICATSNMLKIFRYADLNRLGLAGR